MDKSMICMSRAGMMSINMPNLRHRRTWTAFKFIPAGNAYSLPDYWDYKCFTMGIWYGMINENRFGGKNIWLIHIR